MLVDATVGHKLLSFRVAFSSYNQILIHPNDQKQIASSPSVAFTVTSFKATNNEAKYEALFAGLSLAKEMGIKKLEVKSDSQLVVNQLQGSYQVRDPKMTSYLSLAKELQSAFEEIAITQVPRYDNTHADALANLGSAFQASSPTIIPLFHL
ncbi:uncharacterized protein LOC116119024 [Pistacia vera]|uniref:uncharacterized protein LOC116119024 n=1 Tax=Pistacia vera TaxID=55513 RepID=UPI001263C2F5|nr:uncharacterized protein LOC116119024 [Pistacia vera]